MLLVRKRAASLVFKTHRNRIWIPSVIFWQEGRCSKLQKLPARKKAVLSEMFGLIFGYVE